MATTTSNEPLRALQRARYISLETYRKNGTGVKTPVWFAHMGEGDGESLVVVTNKDSYKVKRLRRNGDIRVAACNVNGKKILGDWFAGQGEIITEPDTANEALRLLKRKYTWHWRIFSLASRLCGRQRDWALLRLRL